MNQFSDKELRCVACRSTFVWTGQEQRFFHDNGLTNEPKRCRPCRDAKKAEYARAQQEKGKPVVFDVQCAGCGAGTTVPFVPTQGRPVLCRRCFTSPGQAA